MKKLVDTRLKHWRKFSFLFTLFSIIILLVGFFSFSNLNGLWLSLLDIGLLIVFPYIVLPKLNKLDQQKCKELKKIYSYISFPIGDWRFFVLIISHLIYFSIIFIIPFVGFCLIVPIPYILYKYRQGLDNKKIFPKEPYSEGEYEKISA